MDSESELLSLFIQLADIIRSTDSYSKRDSELAQVIIQIIQLVSSMDLDSLPKPESELISRVKQIISLFNSLSDSGPESEFVSIVTQIISLGSSRDSALEPRREGKIMYLVNSIYCLTPAPEILSLSGEIISLVISMHSSLEKKLHSLITQIISSLRSIASESDSEPKPESELGSLIKQIVHIGRSMDLNSQPKLKSKLISRTSQVISLFNSISEAEPESELVSLVTQLISLGSPIDSESESESNLIRLINQLLSLQPKPKLISLIVKISFLVRSMNSEPRQLISLCPQVEVYLVDGKFLVRGKVKLGWRQTGRSCDPRNKDFHRIKTGDYTAYFRCRECNGEDHDEEYDKAPIEVNHYLHRKHSLQLVLLRTGSRTRKCYCCADDLLEVFYYCSACDYAINIACVEKSPLLTIEYPKWHEHTLILFSRQAFLTCDVCSLADSSSPIYMCPPCDFVVHLRCLNLPRVIRISRHLHRISFTPSFGRGDSSCGVCRTKIDNDCGGYSCIREGCLYVAHSRCATQRNVWDGVDLEGEQEDIEEEGEPFVRISDGIIQHFSHEHHHLKLDENTIRDYDENKHCQACIMPISYGNFYSCMQCEFILHEACANLSRKRNHPTHPHMLTLVTKHVERIQTVIPCLVCLSLCTGFFYKCFDNRCCFKVHVQCTTISEPLVHESHMHHLFLTSKPGERRTCNVCEEVCIASQQAYREAFNCLECDFSLCFKCATLPQKVRYKHDKHMLSLSYGEDTTTMTSWCEACERKINKKEGFYKCDEYCCVILHIECLLGRDFYMKPGLLLTRSSFMEIDVLPNNNRMTRPICKSCLKRCPQKIVFLNSGLIYCSLPCAYERGF